MSLALPAAAATAGTLPAPMAYAPLILQAGGGIASAIGGAASASSANFNARMDALQARSQGSAARYQGQMDAIGYGERAGSADTNAMLASADSDAYERAAGDVWDRAYAEAAARGFEHAQLRGRQRAALAANGVDLGQGSAAEVQASADYLRDVDYDAIRTTAAREAWGYQRQADAADLEAAQYRTEARGYRSRAGTSRTYGRLAQGAGEVAAAAARTNRASPGLAATTSLIGSAGQVAESWYRIARSRSGA